MEKTDLEPFVGRRICIHLRDGYRYSGQILTLNGDHLLFEDKFGKNILVRFDSLAAIQEIQEVERQ